MGAYQNTSLWKRTLGAEGEHQKDLEFLRSQYDILRTNADLLSKEINRVLPDFTVHDITHLDALWEMADLLLPDGYPLTPAEAFVMGASFLLHDLGMALAAYPEGIEGVRREQLWRDTVAALCKQRELAFDFDRIDDIDETIRKTATETTVRSLHADKARQLGKTAWTVGGNTIYLIDDLHLRESYGEIVGVIAQSHGWGSDRLSREFPTKLGAMGRFPSSWEVDPLKLACIIRLTDAMNIDERRAPTLLRAVRPLGDYSMLHWIFQGKLHQPRLENRRVAYTSKSAFTQKEMDAWWLCYDVLCWLDVELRNVDAILAETGRETFGVMGVCGIDSLKDLTKRITVEGWEPVDTRIRVGNVAKLVQTLGGQYLYGNNKLVPLREMIQNGADAVRARQLLDGDSGLAYGVTVTLGTEDGTEYVEVEDNGIGMSPDTMVNVLLDFGQSFWGTDHMHREFPGLEETLFRSTGKFGIGFFSVFMWGQHVKISSLRYDKGREDTMVLEFSAGVEARPVLRRAAPNEQLKWGGTRVRVYLSEQTLSGIFESRGEYALTLDEVLAQLCCALDCDLYLNEGGKRRRIVQANDWLTISADELFRRLCGTKAVEKALEKSPDAYRMMCEHMRPIEENGTVVGRASLFDPNVSYHYYSWGCVTVGGFQTESTQGICGLLKGDITRAARDSAVPLISQDSLDRWVQEQAELLLADKCSDEMQFELSQYACALTRVNTRLAITRWKDAYLNYDEIIDKVRNSDQNRYILIYDSQLHRRIEDQKDPTPYDNVFTYSVGVPAILQPPLSGMSDNWPQLDSDVMNAYDAAATEYRVIQAIAEGWGVPPDLLRAQVKKADEKPRERIPVGTLNGKEVKRGAYALEKPAPVT